MYKTPLILLAFMCVASLSYAQTHVLNTGIRYFYFTADLPNTSHINEYVIHDSLHNSLDYYFYNNFMNVHAFLGFPSLYSSAKANQILKSNEPLYAEANNAFDRSTVAGLTVSPSITIDALSPFEINLSLGPSFFVYTYQLFFLSNDIVDIKSNNDPYYYPLNTANFGFGFEGSILTSYFLNEHWGISAAIQGSFYWIFNSLKFSGNTIDITHTSPVDDKNTNSYGISLGAAYKF